MRVARKVHGGIPRWARCRPHLLQSHAGVIIAAHQDPLQTGAGGVGLFGVWGRRPLRRSRRGAIPFLCPGRG